MTSYKLMELIYDKLADNDEQEQFNCSDVDDLYIDYDENAIYIGSHGDYWEIKARKVEHEAE